MILYESKFSRRELREGLVLRTLPYHVNRYGKLPDRKVSRGSGGIEPLGRSIANIAMIGARPAPLAPVAPLGATGTMGARQESIVYRHAHGAALGASP
jgi:hypothetical protein